MSAPWKRSVSPPTPPYHKQSANNWRDNYRDASATVVSPRMYDTVNKNTPREESPYYPSYPPAPTKLDQPYRSPRPSSSDPPHASRQSSAHMPQYPQMYTPRQPSSSEFASSTSSPAPPASHSKGVPQRSMSPQIQNYNQYNNNSVTKTPSASLSNGNYPQPPSRLSVSPAPAPTATSSTSASTSVTLTANGRQLRPSTQPQMYGYPTRSSSISSASSSSNYAATAASTVTVTANANHLRGVSPSTSITSTTSSSSRTLSPFFQTPNGSLYNQKRKNGTIREAMMDEECVGFQNLGNTCYMNSVMQCLTHIDKLYNFCIEYVPKNDKNTLAAVAKTMKRVDEVKNNGDRQSRTVAPKTLRERMQTIFGKGHQDAHECLRLMLDFMNEDISGKGVATSVHLPIEMVDQPDTVCADHMWKDYWNRNATLITGLFAGQLKGTVTCHSCQQTTRTFEPFLDLSVPLPLPLGEHTFITVHDCLDAFTVTERLKDTNQVMCELCGCQGDANRQLSISRFPEILVIHLKRFYADGRKNLLRVDYPNPDALLDLTRFIDENSPDANSAKFKLIGVVCHYGSNSFGHYVAYCRNASDVWYEYNDDRVRRVDARHVVNPHAYLLFYQRARE